MPYTLFNIQDNKQLKHPQKGDWHTNSKQEADEALLDFYDYLNAVGMGHMKNNFTVIEVGSN